MSHSTVPWLCLITSLQYAKLLTFIYETYHWWNNMSPCNPRTRHFTSWLNSLLKGLSGKEISRLQRQQNRAAKLIYMAKKSDHVSPLIEQLHCLPVHKRIDFKMCTISFKCYSDCAPSYVKELITPYQPNNVDFRFPDVNKAKNLFKVF